MKKLLIGATFAAAALASTQLLADPGHGRHGQNTPCTGEKCPAASAEGHGRHGAGQGGRHGRMQAMHGGQQDKGTHGNHRGSGAQRGNAGEGCPMHTERKPT